MIQPDRLYTIASHTGAVIEAAEDGEGLRLAKYTRKPNQKWRFIREGNGVYRICNAATGNCIDLMLTGVVNGTGLHQWRSLACPTQMWILKLAPSGEYRLCSQWATGKCMDTVGMGAAPGAALQIWQEVKDGDQLWAIHEVRGK